MLENNLNVLQKQYPEIFMTLQAMENELKENIEVYPLEGFPYENAQIIKDGMDIYLHSAFDPLNEAEKWSNTMNTELDMYFIVGGGFYYHIDYLIKQYSHKKIVIMEPSYTIFLNAMKKIDMTKYFENENILFYVTQEPHEIVYSLARILINKGIQQFEVKALMAYRQLYSDFCYQIEKDIFDMIKTLRANIATEYVHSKKWVYNTLRNLKYTNIDSMPLYSLFNRYKNMPALIVSAGPSLEKQLNVLRENKDKFLILAAGSAVNILEKNNIIPHIVVGVDAEEVQDNIYKSIESKDIALAYCHTFRYSSLEAFKGNKFWFKGNADQTIDYFEEFIGQKTEAIEIGPSCANEAMDIARRLGCNPLIFIGQDLAYTNDKLYSTGAVHNLDISSDIGDRILTEDMYGNPITTKTPFLVMKAYFENYIKSHKEVQYINCTEGGLKIDGMKQTSFKETISNLPSIGIDVYKDLKGAYDSIQEEVKKESYYSKNLEFLEEIKEEAKEIKEKSNKRIQKIKGLKEELFDLENNEIQEKIDKIVNITDEIEKNKIHAQIIYPISAAYFLTIRQTTYNKLEKIKDLKEKYALLLDGMEKQYLFYEIILDTLLESFQE